MDIALSRLSGKNSIECSKRLAVDRIFIKAVDKHCHVGLAENAEAEPATKNAPPVKFFQNDRQGTKLNYCEAVSSNTELSDGGCTTDLVRGTDVQATTMPEWDKTPPSAPMIC